MNPAVKVLRRLRGDNNEGVLALVLIVLVIGMSIANPAFFSLRTLYQLVFNSMVPLVFALAVLLVIISGGIDVSFAAIAIFAAYTTVKLFVSGGSAGGWLGLGALLVALVIGAGLGLVNGAVIARFRMPTLIATLGTQSIFKGALLTWIGSQYIDHIPANMDALSGATILKTADGYLHVLIIPVLLLAVGVSLLLRKTMFGRSIYAIGGDLEAARRVGFKVVPAQLLLYVIVGMMAAFGGVIYVILGRNANPQTLVGGELDIIAAVVLGGASIFGGRGSVIGTVLGVVLIQVINNSLLMIGVPSAWQRAAVGLLLLIGVGTQAMTAARAKKAATLAHEEMAITAYEKAASAAPEEVSA